MEIYLVGGAVRDRLLGLAVTERDWVVVGATEADMLARGYRKADARFPVFLHPETQEEYALARRETKSGPGYKGFEVDTSPDITLQEDLARRDLTINAMAECADGEIVDPFAGQEDLAARLLRHVTPAFSEDPVRLLRIARFAAYLGRWGFQVSHDTQQLLREMAASADLQHLQDERVWREMRKALLAEQPWRFFEVLVDCGALANVVPELTGKIVQRSDVHAGGPSLAALRTLSELEEALPVRFAAIFGGLESGSVEALCARIKPEADCCVMLRRMNEFCPSIRAMDGGDAAAMVTLFHRLRAFQHPERLTDMLRVCVALKVLSATTARRLEGALAVAGGVSSRELVSQGHRGPALREALDRRREESVRRWLTSLDSS